MQHAIVVLLAALTAMVLAEGQYYVPRAYYTIDSDGHESIPVPLRRLRRSLNPAAGTSASASASANSNAWSGGVASAHARANTGYWGLPSFGGYGASSPNLLRH